MSELLVGQVTSVAEDRGERLDVVMNRHIAERSRTVLRGWIEAGLVTVKGVVVTKPATRIEAGVVIGFEEPPRLPLDIEAEDIPIEVLWEDDDILVVDKSAGLVVHPAYGHRSGTLVNALVGRALAAAPPDEPAKPGIVHRLDKDTTGCLVVAKTDQARTGLEAQFRNREVGKIYLAIVCGRTPSEGKSDEPVGRDPHNRKRMSIRSTRGRAANTSFKRREIFARASFLEVVITTGRTHQIRVHLAGLGHPVVGDDTYGGRRKGDPLIASFPRQALHAHQLSFRHPRTGESLTICSPLPIDMEELLGALRTGDS